MFDFLHHFIFPHHTNNHKARALHSQAFVFYILLIFVVQVSLKTVRTTFPNILGFATDISVQNLLVDTNQKRTEAGLPPLTLSSTLSSAAANKAADMFSKNYWAHIAPDGKSPWDFINASGYHYIYAGENLAKNFNDSAGVVNAWMDSPSHRDNMLKKEYQDVGFAVVNGRLDGEDTTLVVQMFGSQNAQLAQNPPATTIPTQIPQPTQVAVLLPTTIPTVAPAVVNILPTIINITPTIIISPGILNSEKVPSQQIKVAASSNIPLVNINTLSKTISLSLVGFLLFILGMDSIFIWRRKTIRVSGHNFAHMLFLISLIGIIYVTGTGAIM